MDTIIHLKGLSLAFSPKDAAGNLTHPGISTHTHAVYSDNETDLTGHVESVGVAKGAKLLLPKINTQQQEGKQ